MLKRSKILDNLITDTENNKIKWNVSITDDFIRATFDSTITEKKKVNFKLVYFINYPKCSRLDISYKTTESDLSIMDLGGRDKKDEVTEICFLLNKILLKEEEA